jgi:hypothetical protein
MSNYSSRRRLDIRAEPTSIDRKNPTTKSLYESTNYSESDNESWIENQQGKYFESYETVHISKDLIYVGPVSRCTGKFHGFGRIMTEKGEQIYEGKIPIRYPVTLTGNFENGKYEGYGKIFNILKSNFPQSSKAGLYSISN